MKKNIIFIAIFLILDLGILLLQSKNNPAIAQQDGEAGIAPNSGFDSGRPSDPIQAAAEPPPAESPAAQTPPLPVESPAAQAPPPPAVEQPAIQTQLPAEHTLNLPNHTREADLQEPVLEQFIAGQEEHETIQEPLPQAERPQALIRERATAPAEVQKQAKEFVQIQKTVQERLPSIPVLPAAVPTQVLLNAPAPAPTPAPALNSPLPNDGRPAQFNIPQAFPQAIEQPSSDEQRTAEAPAFEQPPADDEVTAEELYNEPSPVVEESELRSNPTTTTANNNSSQGPLICCRLTSDETGDPIFRTKTKGDCVDELGIVFGTGSCRAGTP